MTDIQEYTQKQNYTQKPQIIISETDYRQLLDLTAGRADAADDLLSEVERARVVAENAIPEHVVRMGSLVRYRPDNGPEREVTLVYPADADISAGRISVLTPIGTALIGLAQGQSIIWHARDGREHLLTVVAVK